MRRERSVRFAEMKAPSLVDLCVDVAIQNVKHLGDVGDTDFSLLERILPHCTLDQLMLVEDRTDKDLSPVTDKLWKKFFERQFGVRSMDTVIDRMNKTKVIFKWRNLYEAKLKDVDEAENRAIDRFKKSYEEQAAKKQSRQIRMCSKVPPNKKRSFYGGSGPGCSAKNSILKKAKNDFLNCREVKNIAAMKNIDVQRSKRNNVMRLG